MTKYSKHHSIDHLNICVWKSKQSTPMFECVRWWWWCIILSIYNHLHKTHTASSLTGFFVSKNKPVGLRKEKRALHQDKSVQMEGIKFRNDSLNCDCESICVCACKVGSNDQNESNAVDVDDGDYYDYFVAYWSTKCLKIRNAYHFSHRRDWNPISKWSISHKYSSYYNVSIKQHLLLNEN